MMEAIEAGRETDALIAVTFFGWRWMRFPSAGGAILTGLYPPPAPGRVCSLGADEATWDTDTTYEELWEPSDALAPRFENWDTGRWLEGHDMHYGFPHYSTDIKAAWEVWLKARTLSRTKQVAFWLALRMLVGLRVGKDYRISDIEVALHMEPDDICRAMLEAHGVRSLPAWYYEEASDGA